MRSYQVYEHGSPSTLQIHDIPAPVPSKGEMLVNVEAIGVNFPDVLMISGEYQRLPARPFTPGTAFAGTVAAVGENVTGFQPGDRVMSQIDWGALAEQAVTTPEESFHLPESMNFNEGAAMGLVYQTAYLALVERGRYQTGETVLIGGAAGGVGLAAVQIAKGLGAKVLACVRNHAEAQAVREAGADHVIDLAQGDLKERVREQVFAVTEGAGADVVLDPLGGDFFAGALRAVAWCGRVVVIGFAAGGIPQLKVNYLLLKNISVIGLQGSDYSERRPGVVSRAQDELFRLWHQAAVRPRIMRIFSFDEAAEALELVRQGKVQGRVVISVNQGDAP